MSKEKGFSLIELLVTVGIILIVAAIAIPNLMRSRMAANEANTVGSLHAINTSEAVYQTSFGTGFSSNLASLGGSCSATTTPTSVAACLLDSVLAADPATKSGYTITYTGAGSPISSYTVTASPITAGSSGLRYFFTDDSTVIRADASTAATASSSPI